MEKFPVYVRASRSFSSRQYGKGGEISGMETSLIFRPYQEEWKNQNWSKDEFVIFVSEKAYTELGKARQFAHSYHYHHSENTTKVWGDNRGWSGEQTAPLSADVKQELLVAVMSSGKVEIGKDEFHLGGIFL